MRVENNSECVSLVKKWCGLGHTSTWRKGKPVEGNKIPYGTGVGVFGADGKYHNKSGESHVGVKVHQNEYGVWLLEQANGLPPRIRFYQFGYDKGKPIENGSNYYVIEEQR